MSRTFRRKVTTGKTELSWALYNWRDTTWEQPYPPPFDPKSKEGRKAVAMFHADGYRMFKEPGPAWYRHMTVERPQRREAKRTMQRVLRGEEFEVMLCAKKPLMYWM